MQSTRMRYVIMSITVALVVVAGIVWSQRGYGEVGAQAYEYAKALYSICNRRDADRLDAFSRQMEVASQTGDLSEQETRWLRGIMQQAHAGKWAAATRESRRLLEDQVVW